MRDTRERIIASTAEFFRRQGYHGTGLKQILADANAPFGSLYHHFPGGKEQLGAEVIRHSGQLYRELFEMILDAAPDVVVGVENFFVGAAETLRQTDYADACPIATIALEISSHSEAMREACVEVFESWLAAASGRFATAGIPLVASRELAVAMLAGLEGAFILSRTLKSTLPMDIAGAAATTSVRAALAG